MKTPSKSVLARMNRQAYQVMRDTEKGLRMALDAREGRRVPYHNDILDDIIDYRLWAGAVLDGRYEDAYCIQRALDTIARENLPDFTYNTIEEINARITTLE